MSTVPEQTYDFSEPYKLQQPTSMLYNTCAAAVASPVVVVAYYPFRDAAKQYGRVDNPAGFALSRYRGMLTAPEIPLLVSLPFTATLLTYVGVDHLTGSAVLPSIAAGNAGAATRQFVRNYSLNIGRRKTAHGDFLFRSPLACIRGVTAERGAAYWVQGVLPLGVVNTLWYGAALRAIRWQVRREQRSYFEDVFVAARTMSFWSFFWTPLRNATHDVVRNVVVNDTRHRLSFGGEFVRNEAHICRRSVQLMGSTLRNEGLGAMFRGSIMVIFKTNLPFAFFFATYRLFGGTV